MHVDVESVFRALRRGDVSVLTPSTAALTNKDGETLLHQAAARGLLEQVDPAVLTPSNMLKVNSEGDTVLDIARSKSQMHMLPPATKAALFPKKNKPLRAYQQKTVDNAKAWHAEPIEPTDAHTRQALICLATGLGKTTTAAAFIRELLDPKFKSRFESGEKILWVAHRDELIDQAVTEIQALTGEPCEVEQGELRASGKGRIVVASVQSLHADRLADFQQRFGATTIFIDEAHHAAAPTYVSILNAFPEAKVVNMTATTFRNDIRDPLDLGRELIYMTFKDGVKLGYLAEPKLLKKLELDLSGVGKRAGDYEPESLAKAMCREDNVRLCMELLEKYLPGQRSLIYAASVAHGEMLTERLNAKGLKVAGVYGDTPPVEKRKELYDQLRRGELHAIVNFNVLLEGFDMPELTQIVNMRPTTSDVLSVQMWGRGARIDPNNPSKKVFFALDTADLKKVRKGLHAVLPSDEELKQARAHEANPELSRWELFLSRFKRIAEVVDDINGKGVALKEIKTPEDLYRVFRPKFTEPDPVLNELREVWPNANTAKEIRDVIGVLQFTSVATFTKNMMDRGFLFSKKGEMPHDMATLEAMVEDNSNEFAGAREDVRQGVDPVYNILGDTVNFITEIERGRLDSQEQINECTDEVCYPDGTTVVWRRPMGTSGRFNFLTYSVKDETGSVSYLIVRDKETDKVLTFDSTRQRELVPLPDQPFIPAALPGFCRTRDWMKQPFSSDQRRHLKVALTRQLKPSDPMEIESKLDPANPNRLQINRMAASVMISSFVFNELHFKSIDRRYERFLELARPATLTQTETPKPRPTAGRPAPVSTPEPAAFTAPRQRTTNGLTPNQIAKTLQPHIQALAATHDVDQGALNNAVIKELWMLHHHNQLTSEKVADALKDPAALIAKMRQPVNDIS